MRNNEYVTKQDFTISKLNFHIKKKQLRIISSTDPRSSGEINTMIVQA